MARVRLGGGAMEVNPDEVRWNFKMKATDTKTFGGKVIQVTGIHMSDITVKGKYSPNRAKGDTEAWQQQLRFRDWVNTLTEGAEAAKHSRAKPLRFSYEPRGWNFDVFIMNFSPLHMAVDEIAQTYELTLFPVQEGSRAIVEGIKDLYLKRLLTGVGWKQTDYNGPLLQSDVDAFLQPYGGSVEQYLASRYEEEYGGTGGGTTP